VYVRISLNAEIWQYSGDNNMFEVLWITFGNLYVGVVYHPPKPSNDVESFLDYLEATIDEISCNYLLQKSSWRETSISCRTQS